MKSTFQKLLVVIVAFFAFQNLAKSQTVLFKENFDNIAHIYVLNYPKPVGWTIIKQFPADSSIAYYLDTTGGTNASAGYYAPDSASGLTHLTIRNNFDSTGTYTLISPAISTVGKTGISIIWGSRISTNFTTGGSTVPALYYSINNGSTWTLLPHTESAGGSVWGLVNGGSVINLPASADNQAALLFKWSTYIFSANNGTYRMDDIQVSATGTVIPCDTVINITVSGITTTSALLNWAAIANASNYTIYYKPSSGSTWSNVTTATNSYTLTGLISNTSYDFKIVTNCNNNQNSANTIVHSFTTLIPVCKVPTNLSATAIATTSVQLNWTAVGSATNYNVQYKIFSVGSWTTVVSASNTYTLSGLTPSTKYYFQVQSNCGSGNLSNYSILDSFTTLTPVCTIPTNLAATSITSTTTQLGWAAVGSAISYNVQYKIFSAGTWTTVVSATNSYALSGLTPLTKYYFQIQANCGSGNLSNYSVKDSFTTAAPPVCNIPSNLTVANLTSTSVQLNWTAVASATIYNVQYKLSSGSTWTTVVSATNSYSLSSLTPATSYDFQVQTDCGSGNVSNYSGSTSFFTLASVITCGTPSSLSATSITSTSAIINWNVISSALSYNLQYKVHSSSSWITVVCATNSYSFNGLLPATSYDLQVQANCGSGNISSFSLDLSFVTASSNSNCIVPSSLIQATNITATSAKLNWAGVSNAIGYNVQYKPASSSVWQTTSCSSYNVQLNGLTPATTYDYAIQANCGNGNLSTFSANNIFTTLNSTGIEQISTTDEYLKVYPNPVSTTLIVSSKSAINSMIVLNVLGEYLNTNISRISSDQFQLETQSLPAGVYFVKVIGANGFSPITKFIKD